jgi:hypothetical protein
VGGTLARTWSVGLMGLVLLIVLLAQLLLLLIAH